MLGRLSALQNDTAFCRPLLCQLVRPVKIFSGGARHLTQSTENATLASTAGAPVAAAAASALWEKHMSLVPPASIQRADGVESLPFYSHYPLDRKEEWRRCALCVP